MAFFIFVCYHGHTLYKRLLDWISVYPRKILKIDSGSRFSLYSEGAAGGWVGAVSFRGGGGKG